MDSNSNQVPNKRVEIDVVGKYANKILHTSKQYHSKYSPVFDKKMSRLNVLIKELCMEEDILSLSSHAQFLLLEALRDLRQLISDMSNEHLQGHHTISLCNKKLDQLFHRDLSLLLRNEKSLEDPGVLDHVNRLIFSHFVTLGRTDVADTFKKESELSLQVLGSLDVNLIAQIMVPFRERNYLPAINWLKLNSPEKDELIFGLERQHVISLLETKGKLAALTYTKGIFHEKYQDDIAHLMFVVMSYPNKGPYGYLFHDGNRLELEKELSKALTSNVQSSLTTLLSAGIRTIPSLITMRALLQSARSGSHIALPEELPCNVFIPEPVHSTFCCPILKVQSTDSNPPVRLHCGHVISTEALNKLTQQSRNNRFKCPYCPVESNVQDVVTVYF